jgi:serine/threonine protein kinase
MPPEFSSHNGVNEKYDVYSLGIIIIQIMAGHSGFSEFREKGDVKQLIDLVRTISLKHDQFIQSKIAHLHYILYPQIYSFVLIP